MCKNIKEIQFKEKASNIHNNFYDYSLVNYRKVRIKLDIICPIHGVFKQEMHDHLKGRGCKKCYIASKILNQSKVIETFISIHGDKYDYSNFKYRGWNVKSDIICPIHGIFKQSYNNHYKKKGCPSCGNNSSSVKQKSNTKEFIEKANIKHNNCYNYSKVKYINSTTKVIIICPLHGDFKQIPNNHLIGKGCPVCKQSKGEKKISQYLDRYNINYETQKSFEDLVGNNKKRLKYDFFLNDYNCLIEYDGKQHFEVVNYFGGLDGFNKRKLLDEKKNDYSKQNNIKLIRIPYWDIKNIDSILQKNINI